MRQGLRGYCPGRTPTADAPSCLWRSPGARFYELRRFVLLDHVGGNGEIFFLARFILQLGQDNRPLDDFCPAYSDLAARTTVGGSIISPRALSKLRNEERGGTSAYDLLRKCRAPVIIPEEKEADYIRRPSQEGSFRRLRHGGTHATRGQTRVPMDKGLSHPLDDRSPHASLTGSRVILQYSNQRGGG